MGATLRKRDQYKEFLRGVELLHDLDNWECGQVADALEPVAFPAGTTVVEQGQPGDEFFIIINGACEVTQEVGGQVGVVGQLSAGQYFGEIALVTGEPRRATVTAKTDLKCGKLDRHTFERVLGPCQDILKRNIGRYKKFVPGATD